MLYRIRVNPDHNVVMVTHDSIGAQIDGEHRAQQFDAINNPLTAMLKVKASVGILATKEGSSHTAGDAVVVRRVV